MLVHAPTDAEVQAAPPGLNGMLPPPALVSSSPTLAQDEPSLTTDCAPPSTGKTFCEDNGNRREQLIRFLDALFQPGDTIAIKPIETWTEDGAKKTRTDYQGFTYLVGGSFSADRVDQIIARSHQQQTNLFFGVCPRFGAGQRFERAFQIRTVRCLWADIDNCSVDEAVARCETVQLPRPSIIVRSGHGVHLYWLLVSPYEIDDVGEPPAVEKEFVASEIEGKKKCVQWFFDCETGQKRYLHDPTPGTRSKKLRDPALSDKAKRLSAIVGGIANRIAGDHTKDLARLLRLPGTLNRKDKRNGKDPVPCELIECDPERRYEIEVFTPFAIEAKTPRLVRPSSTVVSSAPPAPRNLSALGCETNDRLAVLVATCATAPVGKRSEADYHLCCVAVEKGWPKEEVWAACQGIGKFAEQGRSYFDRTWENAAQKTDRDNLPKNQTESASSADASGKFTGLSGPIQSPPDLETRELETQTVIAGQQASADGSSAAFPMTDLGNAHRLVAQHGADLRYCHPWGQWLVWDGQRWRCDDTGEVRRRAHATARSLYIEASSSPASRDLGRWAVRSESSAAINNMLREAQALAGIPILPAALDQEPFLLNVLNGTIDLRT